MSAFKSSTVAAFVCVALCHAQGSLGIHGIDSTSATLSVSDLSKMPQQTVMATDHGTPATFEGVLLTDVLAKVALPTGEKFHGTAASYFLLVEAKDGYRAVFAWAELDSTFVDKDGPFQLVVPGEKRGARWVRQVTALRIRQAN